MNEEKISKSSIVGADRAAILLLAIGEDRASSVLKYLDPKEAQQIGVAMAGMGAVQKESVVDVLGNFIVQVQEQTSLTVGTENYIRKVFTNALGDDLAGTAIDRILQGGLSRGLDALKWMDPKAISEIIRLEHPQIVATILAYLDADQAAQILTHLPENQRVDVIMRVATLDGIPPIALEELDEVLEKQFSGVNTLKSTSAGGIKSAAGIMNFLNGTMEAALIAEVQKADADLAQKIQDKMFVFDNLMSVDDRGIQALLRDIQSETLVVALKGAEEGVREKFLKNMSKRAAEVLGDDLESRGPVRLSDVEAAQKEILTLARKMAEEGKLSLGGGGEAYV